MLVNPVRVLIEIKEKENIKDSSNNYSTPKSEVMDVLNGKWQLLI